MLLIGACGAPGALALYLVAEESRGERGCARAGEIAKASLCKQRTATLMLAWGNGAAGQTGPPAVSHADSVTEEGIVTVSVETVVGLLWKKNHVKDHRVPVSSCCKLVSSRNIIYYLYCFSIVRLGRMDCVVTVQ